MLEGVVKPLLPLLTDRQCRPRTDQRDMRTARYVQGAGQLRRRLAVVADHGTEVLGVQRTVEGDYRGAGCQQGSVTGIVGWQAAGDDQRVATA